MTPGRKPRMVVTPDGETMPLKEAAKKYGLRAKTLHRRIELNMPQETLFDPVREYKVPERFIARVNGRDIPLSELLTRRRYRTFKRRLNDGWPFFDALTVPNQVKKYLSPWGLLSVRQIADKQGLTSALVIGRIENCWMTDEAFNTPRYGKKGVDFIIPRKEWRQRCKLALDIIHTVDGAYDE